MKCFIKILLIIILLLAASCFVTVNLAVNRNTEYIGNIIKVSQSGIICPTWEVELIRTRGFINGLNGNTITTTSSREEYFTVENLETLKTIKNAMDKQQEVKIITHTELATFCRSDSDNQFIDSIENLK